MKIEAAYQKGFLKVDFLKEKLRMQFPHITKNGQWLTNDAGHWTGGFWIGLLWLQAMQEQSNRTDTVNLAVELTKKLSVRMSDNKTHDMGFIFGPSCILGSTLVKEARERFIDMATSGAQNMVDLFNDDIGLVLAWDEPGYEGVSIVDTIMNAPLMIKIGQEKHNQDLIDKGIKLADTIEREHIRDDFSTYHVVQWDPTTNEILKKGTHQGYDDKSCWSRGQAWTLYGFANMYRYTEKINYLNASEKTAQYFWDHLDRDLCLPRWDFTFKNKTNEPLDAAAASIAASGMQLLASILMKQGEKEKSLLWQSRSLKLIQALINHCLYKDISKYGIIEKVTVDKPRKSGINESAMYGDYYFMEAIYRHVHEEDQTMLNRLF